MKYALKIQIQIQIHQNHMKKFAALVIVQNHAEQLKCSQHDTKSDGYKDVYLCCI